MSFSHNALIIMSLDAIQQPVYGFTVDQIERKLGQRTTVRLASGEEIDGYLYNVDPITHTIFLLKVSELEFSD